MGSRRQCRLKQLKTCCAGLMRRRLAPEKLTDLALAALLDAEGTDSVVGSAATISDLWYASHKSGLSFLALGVFELIRRLIDSFWPRLRS